MICCLSELVIVILFLFLEEVVLSADAVSWWLGGDFERSSANRRTREGQSHTGLALMPTLGDILMPVGKKTESCSIRRKMNSRFSVDLRCVAC